MKQYSDPEILALLQDLDTSKQDRAFAFIYQNYFPGIKHYILTNNGNEDTAKDVFQDACIVLFNNIKSGKFRGDSTVKTYLSSICRLMWLKKITRAPKQEEINEGLEYSQLAPDTLDSLMATERESIIARLIADLGAECQKILQLFYFEKLSMKKIQEEMKLASEQVTKNKKSKCMKRLRAKIMENPVFVTLLKKD